MSNLARRSQLLVSLGRGERPPTDFELLRASYDRHRADFESSEARAERSAEILVPIDIPAIAASLGVDPHSVFGRLYHHLEPKYAPPAEPGKAKKVFFAAKSGEDANCVNFPFLEAVLAGLWQERRRDLWVTGTAVLSIGIAVASLIVSIVT